MISETEFLKNLQIVRDQIKSACVEYGRKESEISLLPVTKNWPFEVVEYCKRSGIRSVGENRVQEAVAKMEHVGGVSWELIGHLQSNKAKQVVGAFNRIQTVDSQKIAGKLGELSEKKRIKTKVLLQVKVLDDEAKYGCPPQELEGLINFALSFSSLQVEGLMTIAPYAPEDSEVARRAFIGLRELRDDLSDKMGIDLPELSMGMSMDLNQAIEAGSTMIRIGSALFGSRT